LILDRANLALNVSGKPKEPGSFDEAYNNPNLEERAKWREDIQRELKEMEDEGVYKKIEKSELPSNRGCVKNKWIFKVKRNGIYFGHDLLLVGIAKSLELTFKRVLRQL
jgi:hypothetical protein